METQNCCYENPWIVELTLTESRLIEGGIYMLAPQIIAISVIAGALSCIFEFGKATGHFIYHITH
jgi:hypothetical protein